MGNRTEYLLATIKTPQYDTGAFSNASNQLVNALAAGANQIGEYNKQQSQAYANQYASDLLGKVTPENYYDNAAKIRSIASYASPEMQKNIEGYSSDVKDKMAYLLNKGAHDLAQKTYERSVAKDLLERTNTISGLAGMLPNTQADITQKEFNGKGLVDKVVGLGVNPNVGLSKDQQALIKTGEASGYTPETISAALTGLQDTNMTTADKEALLSSLERDLLPIKPQLETYKDIKNNAEANTRNAESMKQSYTQHSESLAMQKWLNQHQNYAPSREVVKDVNGKYVLLTNGLGPDGKPVQALREEKKTTVYRDNNGNFFTFGDDKQMHPIPVEGAPSDNPVQGLLNRANQNKKQ